MNLKPRGLNWFKTYPFVFALFVALEFVRGLIVGDDQVKNLYW